MVGRLTVARVQLPSPFPWEPRFLITTGTSTTHLVAQAPQVISGLILKFTSSLAGGLLDLNSISSELFSSVTSPQSQLTDPGTSTNVTVTVYTFVIGLQTPTTLAVKLGVPCGWQAGVQTSLACAGADRTIGAVHATAPAATPRWSSRRRLMSVFRSTAAPNGVNLRSS